MDKETQDWGSVQRELGEFNAHMMTMNTRLGELVEQAKTTNGRVNANTTKIAVLEAREERVEAVENRVAKMEGRTGRIMVDAGIPVLASLIVVFGPHLVGA